MGFWGAFGRSGSMLALLGAFAGPALHAQRFPKLAEQFFLGTTRHDYPTRLLMDAQGDLYALGSTEDDLGLRDNLIYKFDTLRHVLWERRWGGPGWDELRDACLAKGGDLLLLGTTGSHVPHYEAADPDRFSDYLVARLNPRDGTELWEERFGGSGQDQAWGIAPNQYDGGVATGGSWSRDFDCRANEKPLNNQWVVMFNREGQILRKAWFGGNKNDWGTSIAASVEGGYVLAGVTNSEDLDFAKARHNGDAWFVKIGFSGNMEWSRIIKAPYEDVVTRVVANKFGLFYAVGSQVTADLGKQFWICKLDDKGRVVFNKTFGGKGFEEFRSLAVCHDGGVVAVGYSDYSELASPYIKGQKDVWVMRFSAQGDLMWQKTFGGPDDETGVDVLEYRPGVLYVLAEKVNNFWPDKHSTGRDFWLLRIDDLPCSSVLPELKTDISNWRERIGVPIKFVNQTNYGDQWLWDFGDGTTSTDRSPIKAYQEAGVYQVRLTATVNESCKVTYYYPKPVIIIR